MTSGFRDPRGQAEAMLDHWIDLKRGEVYKTSALSETDRKQLDDDYVTAFESKKVDGKARKDAAASFLEVAATVKSVHNKGRAVDLATASVPSKALKVLELKMHLVDEGGRTDIYHLENAEKIPAPTDKEKEEWGPAKKGG